MNVLSHKPSPLALLALSVVVGTVGALTVLSGGQLQLLAAAAGGMVLLALLLVGRHQSESFLAAYWLAFCAFSTLLAPYVIGGMFSVFYLALALGVIYRLATGGVRVDPPMVALFLAYLLMLLVSLFEYSGPGTSLAVDRLLAVLLALFASVLITSRAGARIVRGAMVLASAVIAVWVVVNAAQSNFAYRGNVSVNENVASFYIGFGFILAAGYLVLELSRARPSRGSLLASGLFTVLLGYSLSILASRGVILAVLTALVFALICTLLFGRVKRRVLVILPLAVATVLLLPGSSQIVERFNSPNTETGGGRTLIWDVTLDSTLSGNVQQLVLGHGMDASAAVIRQQLSYVSSTHSSYLYVLYNHGLVGLLIFLLLHILLFVRLWRSPSRHRLPLLMLLVFQMATGLFLTASDNYMYWISLGILAGHALLLRSGDGPRTARA